MNKRFENNIIVCECDFCGFGFYSIESPKFGNYTCKKCGRDTGLKIKSAVCEYVKNNVDVNKSIDFLSDWISENFSVEFIYYILSSCYRMYDIPNKTVNGYWCFTFNFPNDTYISFLEGVSNDIRINIFDNEIKHRGVGIKKMLDNNEDCINIKDNVNYLVSFLITQVKNGSGNRFGEMLLMSERLSEDIIKRIEHIKERNDSIRMYYSETRWLK